MVAKLPKHKNPYAVNTIGGVGFTIGAETGGNTRNVALQLRDQNGKSLAVRGSVEVYLSDDADGGSLAAAAPSGGFAIGTDGLILTEFTANKHAKIISEADGAIDIDIVEAGAATWYLIVVLPDGTLLPSGAITFAG